MDEKMMEILLTRFDRLEEKLTKDLEMTRTELKTDIQNVSDEAKEKELHNYLNTMEIITTKNAYDIAKLKAVK